MLRTFSGRFLILLAAGLAALIVSAAVLAGGSTGSPGQSSNYTGPPVAAPTHVRVSTGSNIPRALRSAPMTPRPHASNRSTTP
jgi:hypothetical protein